MKKMLKIGIAAMAIMVVFAMTSCGSSGSGSSGSSSSASSSSSSESTASSSESTTPNHSFKGVKLYLPSAYKKDTTVKTQTDFTYYDSDGLSGGVVMIQYYPKSSAMYINVAKNGDQIANDMKGTYTITSDKTTTVCGKKARRVQYYMESSGDKAYYDYLYFNYNKRYYIVGLDILNNDYKTKLEKDFQTAVDSIELK